MKPSKKNTMSASQFIRSLPATMKASEVHARALREGYRFQPNLIYAVRSADRLKTSTVKRAVSTIASEAVSTKGPGVKKVVVDDQLTEAIEEFTDKVAQIILGRIRGAVAA